MAKRKNKNKIRHIYDTGGTIALGNTVTDIQNTPIDTSKLTGLSGGNPVNALFPLGVIGDVAGATGSLIGDAVSGGLQSGAGNAINKTFSTIGNAIPIVGGFVSGVGSVLGGITNALFGSKINQEKVNDIEGSSNTLNNIQVDDSSTSSIVNQFGDTSFGQNFSKKDIGSDGLFSNKAMNTYKRLKREQADAINRAIGNFSNAADNVQDNQILDSMANYSAYGGPLTMRYSGPMSPFGNTFASGGSIYIKPSKRGTFTAAAKKHGKSVQAFASQVLAHKENYSPAMVKKANFAKNASKWHAEGGFLDNTHGGTFSNGVTTVNSGGTHEQNPNKGIQLGTDNQGIPNLVEEGEVIFGNYVFSNRIKAPKEVKRKYRLSGTTFADLAESAQKESAERPYDPISQRGLQDIMMRLATEQESIKQTKNKRNSHRFDDGGFTYGVNMLNLDKNINTDDLYKQGSDYMKARQYVLDNWDTPYVQNWINSYYRPFVTDYNKSRGYNGNFNVNRDQFERGTYDSNFGGMHQGLLNFQYPESSPTPPATVYTTRGRLGGDVSINPDYLGDYGYKIPDNIAETVTDNDGNTINYLEKPAMLSSLPGKSSEKTDDKNPVNPLTYLRYAPVAGSAIGAVQGLLSKPDYSNADAVLEAAKDAGRYMPVDYEPIGNYLTYTPFDRDYYINKLASQAGATRRAARNLSAGNRATALSSLLAADYNAQNNLGNLARQAAEYNFANKEKVETFNRDTDKFNSEMALRAAMANQRALAESAGARLKGTAQAMRMRQNIDDARSNAISANLSNLFNSLGDIGREEVQAEWIKDNPALYYYFSRNGGGEYYKNKSSYGGYITRKNKKRRR